MEANGIQEEMKQSLDDFDHWHIGSSPMKFWKFKSGEVTVYFAGWYTFKQVFTARTDSEFQDTLKSINESKRQQEELKKYIKKCKKDKVKSNPTIEKELEFQINDNFESLMSIIDTDFLTNNFGLTLRLDYEQGDRNDRFKGKLMIHYNISNYIVNYSNTMIRVMNLVLFRGTHR